MKNIIQRNLSLAQKYKLNGVSYIPVLDGGGCCCDNCGRLIANIADITGENDKKRYSIGLDCLDTLLENNDLLNSEDYFKYQYSDKPAIQQAVSLRNKIKKNLKQYPEFYLELYVSDKSDCFGFTFYSQENKSIGFDYTFRQQYLDITLKYINGLCKIVEYKK